MTKQQGWTAGPWLAQDYDDDEGSWQPERRTMGAYFEWRYWLLGFGWRTERQRAIGSRFTLYLGPLRLSFGDFGAHTGRAATP